jgi:hypothetical protein
VFITHLLTTLQAGATTVPGTTIYKQSVGKPDAGMLLIKFAVWLGLTSKNIYYHSYARRVGIRAVLTFFKFCTDMHAQPGKSITNGPIVDVQIHSRLHRALA